MSVISSPKQLAALKKKFKFSLLDVSRASNIWPQTIAQILNGRIVPSKEQLDKLNGAFKLLMGVNNNEPAKE